jgi:glycosyltransferase involved in cell wall biosynthesis
MPVTFSAVIPTKDRAKDLDSAVASVLAQRRLPDELIIVDQSATEDSRALVEAMMRETPAVRLVYVHDRRIGGMVEAKKVGTEHATGDIVCFLEDDIVLETTFLEAVERGFAARPDMLGCSGVITNQPNQSALYATLHRLFFLGIFRDPRPSLFRTSQTSADGLAQCDVLSGGLSAWKRQVFAAVPFDVVNGFHMLEDIEFSTRVVREFGRHLYVNHNARLAHYFSPAGRDAQGARQRRKLKEAIAFFKKRRTWPGAKHGIALVLAWWLGEAVMQSMRTRSIGPVRGYCRGLVDGMRKQLQTSDAVPSQS